MHLIKGAEPVGERVNASIGTRSPSPANWRGGCIPSPILVGCPKYEKGFPSGQTGSRRSGKRIPNAHFVSFSNGCETSGDNPASFRRWRSDFPPFRHSRLSFGGSARPTSCIRVATYCSPTGTAGSTFSGERSNRPVWSSFSGDAVGAKPTSKPRVYRSKQRPRTSSSLPACHSRPKPGRTSGRARSLRFATGA